MAALSCQRDFVLDLESKVGTILTPQIFVFCFFIFTGIFTAI